MFLRMIYDEKLAQASYLIGCQQSGEAIVIDPLRDVDQYIDLASTNDLRIIASTETHIHADFLSGSRELAEQTGAKVYLSDEGDADWKYQWLGKKSGGGSYDHQMLIEGDSIHIGKIELKVIHTPGHTPEHIVFLITDHGSGATDPIGMATGDFVFVGDLGRPDLLETAAGQIGEMEPSARRLFHTLSKLDGIADFVQIWPAHGAGSACGKALGAVPSSTVGYERRFNPAIRAATNEQGFIDFILSGQPEPPLYFANMKRDNKAGPPVLGALPDPKKLRVDELYDLDTQQNVLLDTRPWNEFSARHLPGALSYPLEKSFSTNVGSMVRDTDQIYLIIDSDRREEAIRDLIRIGLDNIVGWFDASELESSLIGDQSLSAIEEADPAAAAGLIQSQEVHVLDVRRATEFSEGHIPGAQNIAHTRLASRLGEVPKDRKLLVHCRSGERSARSSAFLQREGFQVVNLTGGFMAWELEGSPVTS
jgi:hydroxyacylglutathione hydrolase